MKTAEALRQLARDIDNVCRDSPVNSLVTTIAEVMTSHICAIARIHELNEEQNAIHNRS